MKIILSPAKRLNEEKIDYSDQYKEPKFLEHSEDLIKILKKQSKNQISKLMSISPQLSELNYNRFQTWRKEDIPNAKASIFMFEGDAYKGIDISSFTEKELGSINEKLFILSGLYGIIKPFDLILPYRLEMGTKLKNKKGNNLYDFWKDELTEYLNANLDNEPLINLASEEYSKAIDFKRINSPVIKIDFLQEKEGQFKNIAIFSKRARGLMTAFISKNDIQNIEDLKAFDSEKYYYNNNLSKENHLVFTR